MKEEIVAVGKEIPQLVIDLIGIMCPQFAAVERIGEFLASIPNIIFMDKLNRILSRSNHDFFKWLEIHENFDQANKNYQNAVRQLIYTINAINESESLDIYANLMRAYQAGLIDCSDFFRLGWILSNIYSADLLYLKKCYGKSRIEDSPELRQLEQYELAVDHPVALMNGGMNHTYSISALGIKMLACGIDYENYGMYKVEEV